MQTFLSLLGTYTQFAVWQATFWLAAAWILGRIYRQTPWKAHFLSVVGIIVATFTPLLSTIISATSGGLLKNSVPQWIEPQTLGMICLAGTLLFVVVLSYGITMSRKLMFHAVPYPDRESQDALLRHSKTLRNVSLPILFTSPSVKSPTVWCWGLHPAVLLPETLAEKLLGDQRDAVFLHELSHIIRRDHLTSLFARLCGAVLFWNPLYWLVLWESDLAADESCDLLVLTQGKMPPEQYTETLLRLVAGERARPIFQFLSRKEKIMRRIDRILSFDNLLPLPSPAGSRLWTASVFLTALLLSVTLAFCQEKKSTDSEKLFRSLLKIQGLNSYAVGKRIADFPEKPGLETPENAYATQKFKIAEEIKDTEFQKTYKEKFVVWEVLTNGDRAFVFGYREYDKLYDGDMLVKKGTNWMHQGNLQAFTPEELANNLKKRGFLNIKKSESAKEPSASSEKKVSDNPLLRHFQTPIWLLGQEAQERPMFDNYWNDHSTMATFRICMQNGNGGDKWLEITPEQKKKFRFLSKPQEVGVGWFQKKREEQDPELMKAEEEVKNFIPKGDPQMKRATEEQKLAYVKACRKQFDLFETDVSRQLEESLTPEQLEKLRSLDFIQLPEIGIASPAMFDCLGLSDEQQKKVDAIRKELRPEFEKLLDEQMETRLAYLAKMVENVVALDKETPLESQGELMEAMSEAAAEASNDKVVGRKHFESERHRKEFARQLKERLTELLTPEQKDKMQNLIEGASDFLKDFIMKDAEEKPSEKQPERIKSYRVDKKVTEFPADVIDLSTPETAYALGNRIIAGDETDRVERLRQYSVNMNVPKEVVQWLETMDSETKTLLKNAEVLHVFIYKNKHAMVIAEVVKGEKYNNRLFTKQDGKWFTVGGGGLYGKVGIKILETTFAKLADRWDNENEEKVWKTPDVVGHTFLATFTSAGDFKPATAQELLDKLNGPLFKRNNIVTGYFRTAMDGEKMIGRTCTNNPTGLREVFKESPGLELIKLEPLNEKLFEEHLGERIGKQPPESLKNLVKIDGIMSYRVDKKLSDFPDEINLKTPENTYASIRYLIASTREDKIEQLERLAYNPLGKQLPDAERTRSVKIIGKQNASTMITEVLTKDNLAFVLGKQDDGICDGNLFIRKDGQWLSLGIVKTETIEEMAKLMNENYLDVVRTLGLEPPKIAKLEPENNAKEVDPETVKEIRITFDRDMNTTSWSWCGDENSVPKASGEVRYVDKRTCVMPVKLEEKKGYCIYVNSDRFKGFRSADGIPVESVPYRFTTKGADLTPPTVVKFEPENGATDVDADAVKELRITFDRDMEPGMSWCSIGGLAPEMAGGKWIDRRTSVIKVTLKPGRNYLVGINAPMFEGFRSTMDVPAKPVPYSFSTKKKNAEKKPSEKTPSADPSPNPTTDVKVPTGVLADFEQKTAQDRGSKKPGSNTVWKTPDEVGHTHLAVFEPQGDFKPQGAHELLNKLNEQLFKRGDLVTGYFRTWPENGLLVGAVCTNDPESLGNSIAASSSLQLLSIVPLTEALFREHTAKPQRSMK